MVLHIEAEAFRDFYFSRSLLIQGERAQLLANSDEQAVLNGQLRDTSRPERTHRDQLTFQFETLWVFWWNFVRFRNESNRTDHRYMTYRPIEDYFVILEGLTRYGNIPYRVFNRPVFEPVELITGDNQEQVYQSTHDTLLALGPLRSASNSTQSYSQQDWYHARYDERNMLAAGITIDNVARNAAEEARQQLLRRQREMEDDMAARAQRRQEEAAIAASAQLNVQLTLKLEQVQRELDALKARNNVPPAATKGDKSSDASDDDSSRDRRDRRRPDDDDENNSDNNDSQRRVPSDYRLLPNQLEPIETRMNQSLSSRRTSPPTASPVNEADSTHSSKNGNDSESEKSARSASQSPDNSNNNGNRSVSPVTRNRSVSPVQRRIVHDNSTQQRPVPHADDRHRDRSPEQRGRARTRDEDNYDNHHGNNNSNHATTSAARDHSANSHHTVNPHHHTGNSTGQTGLCPAPQSCRGGRRV